MTTILFEKDENFSWANIFVFEISLVQQKGK